MYITTPSHANSTKFKSTDRHSEVFRQTNEPTKQRTIPQLVRTTIMTITVPTPTTGTFTACHGYIIVPDATTPYEITPCTQSPSVPPQLSEACAKSRSSCSKGMYCPAHHCAWSKKASGCTGGLIKPEGVQNEVIQ
jgi:hypothetical protein